MKILVTGTAGFIGYWTVKRLLGKGHEIVGIDNINSYYDTGLKYARLAETGIVQEEIKDNRFAHSKTNPEYKFMKTDLTDRINLAELFRQEAFDIVINLAGQAGVRYSLENPFAYAESNVLGFLNILENCRIHRIKHLLYASSSSVYGMNEHIPYSEDDRTDSPVSLYAATKKSNELMAHTYSAIYKLPTTGLRFFTVYGPWGRPDMAPSLFMKAVLDGQPIKVFNHGNLSRDFTYVDDIITGVLKIMSHIPADDIPFKIYNIGNSAPVKLLDFIDAIEKVSGHKAIKQMTDMQPGDVYCTYADVTKLQEATGYRPAIPIEEGIKRFYEWFVSFYHRK